MAAQTNAYIAIPSILKVEADALSNLGKYMKELNFTNVVLYMGSGLIDLFGDKVLTSLNGAGINVLTYCELDTVDIDDLVSMAFAIPNSCQAIIGLGGGKAIDGAKYMSFLRKLPFISVPTSTATDGFSSASASLIVDGRRNSVPAVMAHAIIVDTDVIKTSPDKYILSGIGDMMSKITALYDWEFEEAHGTSKVNDFAEMVAKKAVNSFIRTPFEDIHEDLFLKELVDSLALSGIANEIAGGSSPTSGSEHLISHALDKMLEFPQQHGIQVGIATYIVAKVQNHRFERINTVFTKTGFWDYCRTLGLKYDDYDKAIDMAPSIKPHRHVYLHEEAYREAAKKVLHEDPIMQSIFS